MPGEAFEGAQEANQSTTLLLGKNSPIPSMKASHYKWFKLLYFLGTF
jgi:hypothetical protein